MANDDTKDEQEPPGFTSAPQQNDLVFPALRNESVNSTGLFNAAGVNNMPNPSTMVSLSSFASEGMQAAPQVYTQGIPNDNSASRSQRIEQGGEVNSGNYRGPQTVRSNVNSGSQTRLLFPTLGGQGLGVNNNSRSSAVQSHSSHKLDGSILKLGIDGPAEALSRCSISGRDISSKNNQTVDLAPTNTSNTQIPRSSVNPHGSMSRVSTTISPGSSQVVGPRRVTSFQELMTPDLSQRVSYFDARRPQHDERHHFSTPSNRIAPQIVASQDAGFASSVSNNYFHGHSTTPLTPGSSQVGVHDSRRRATSDSSRRTSESSMSLPLNTGTRINSQQDQFGEPVTANEGGAIQTSERGQQIPITNANRISQAGSVLDGPSLKRGSLESSPATIQSQRRRIGTPSPIPDLPETAAPTGQAQSAVSLPQQANRISLQHQLQTAPMQYLPQIASSIPPQPGASMLPPQSQFILFPQQRLIASPSSLQPWPARPFPLQPGHFPVVPFIPGHAVIRPPQPQGIAPPEPRNHPHLRPQSQTAPRRGRPPLIRGPAPHEGPHLRPQSQTAPRRGRPRHQRHRRIDDTHRRHPPQNEMARIKWENPDTKPRPLGYKCLLCKRDLSFTEEGPAYMANRAPPVAVLPCGHTFHEYCLNRITPETDAANPPCIPCATGEDG